MAVTQEQAIEIVNRYLVEHPEMQAEVWAAAHDTTGTSWVFLNYYRGGRGVILISPEGTSIKTQTGTDLFKGDPESPPQAKGH